MGSIIEDLYDHEGYGARLLPDGTLTATWSAETASFEAYVAACSCGWRGGEHPPTDEGYDAAVDAWEHDHARPLLADTVPAQRDQRRHGCLAGDHRTRQRARRRLRCGRSTISAVGPDTCASG